MSSKKEKEKEGGKQTNQNKTQKAKPQT